MRVRSVGAACLGCMAIAFVVASSCGPHKNVKPLSLTEPSYRHCAAATDCGPGQQCSMVLGTGFCVDACAASCGPGQVADASGGKCACLAAIGPGSRCSVASDCPSGYDCQQFDPIWGESPVGKVCVDQSRLPCNPASPCPVGKTCATITGQTYGYCADTCSGGPCRFDQHPAGASACICTADDPIGAGCNSDGDCGFTAGVARVCAAVAGGKKCMPAAFCQASDICNNRLDEDCSGADLAPTTEICGNNVDEDCDGVANGCGAACALNPPVYGCTEGVTALDANGQVTCVPPSSVGVPCVANAPWEEYCGMGLYQCDGNGEICVATNQCPGDHVEIDGELMQADDWGDGRLVSAIKRNGQTLVVGPVSGPVSQHLWHLGGHKARLLIRGSDPNTQKPVVDAVEPIPGPGEVVYLGVVLDNPSGMSGRYLRVSSYEYYLLPSQADTNALIAGNYAWAVIVDPMQSPVQVTSSGDLGTSPFPPEF